MKKLLSLVILIFFVTHTHGQTNQDLQDQIMKPIHDLFAGMMKGDSALVHTAFTEDATMVSVGKDRNGNFAVRRQSIEPFLKAIGTPHDEAWQEPIWDVKIESDNVLAQVWVKYAFYIGKNLATVAWMRFNWQILQTVGKYFIWPIPVNARIVISRKR
ncbi:MAG: hypothetical protein HC811_04910 [Flammeovirgaceae bacterium]|nr:hypothetical protein [Flammeovirgaceae bacterium]